MTTLIALAVALLTQDADIEAQFKRLASDEYATRAAAQAELERIAQDHLERVRARVAARLKQESDAEVKQALTDLLAKLPVLSLTLKLDGEAKVGRPLAFRVRIKNVSDAEQSAVRLVNLSDHGARYPKFVAQIRDAAGERPPGLSELMGYSGTSPIRMADTVRLKPGEEFDPLEGRQHAHLSDWAPRTAGKHVVTLTVDYAPADARHWSDPAAPYDHAEDVTWALRSVPAMKLKARAEAVVQP